MQSKLLKSLGLAACIAVSPIAVMAQDMAPPPADPMAPVDPIAPSEPMLPAEPAPPQPGEPMPMPQTGDPLVPPAPETMQQPQGSTDAPMGPMATPPSASSGTAQSGGTTIAMMKPQAATKEYPLCSRTVQDSCRNPGEGPKSVRKPR